jgi:PAS domain S-box-containing protein
MNTDRNLLFGAVAMQCGLMTADQLAEALAVWSAGQSDSLPAVCRDRGWLLAEDEAHIEYLIQRRLNQSGGDIRASLAVCSAEIRSVLAGIGGNTKTGEDLRTVDYSPAGGAEVGATNAGRRYALSKFYAAGGIGEIWKARDTDLGRDVAIKRLQPQKSDSAVHKTRFLREARITGRLEHPGVVPIYELCLDEESGQPYYSMRFLSGRTMTEAVARYHAQRKASGSDPQTFLELLGAFCIVCSTVAYAHSKGVVHRDLKCDNVILGDYGEVVVIDWGLAKELGSHDILPSEGEHAEAAANPAATLAGHVLGTPAYMAPEQAAGRLDLIGPATDVYGLCAVLYEILSGRPPFLGPTTLDVLRKVQHEEPRPPSALVPGVPEPLERICLAGLAKSPAERHPSADRLAKAVQAWVSDLAERRQAEGERERFFALSLDLLAIVGDDGRLRQVSPAWENLLGRDREALVGRPFTDFLHEGDRTSAARWMSATSATAGVYEARALHRDGAYRWVSWNATPIAKERCTYVVGRDITELKKSQQLFEGILQSAPDAMVIVDHTGRIVMANRQLERLFGYAQEEVLGRPVEILLPERYRAGHPAHVSGFFANPSARPMGAGLALWGRRKDGREFPADVAISPITTEAANLAAASVRDMTERDRRSAGAVVPREESAEPS